jgi:hypothetical protein
MRRLMNLFSSIVSPIRRSKGGTDPLEYMDNIPKVAFDVDGEIVEIPVDENGYVPKWALAMRFQEIGDYDSDVGVRSDVVLSGDLTPEEVLDWWLDPSCCDIEGIDDEDPDIYDVSSLPREQQMVQKRLAIVTDPEQQAYIRNVLAASFTIEELEIMSKNGSIVIHTLPDCGDATGCYWRMQDGYEVPLITLQDGCSPDGIVHEFIHHLRAVDNTRTGELRTTYPTDERGRMDNVSFNRLPKEAQDEILEEEERLTTAETVVRTSEDPYQSGYYDYVEGEDPRESYENDRRILRGVPLDTMERDLPKLTGKAAKDAVTRGYKYTAIARANILSRDVKKR